MVWPPSPYLARVTCLPSAVPTKQLLQAPPALLGSPHSTVL